MACSWDEPDDDGCSGCTSRHSYSGSPPTPASVLTSASVSKLVLASGENFAQGHSIRVVWYGDEFTLFRISPLDARGDDDAGDGGTVDGGSIDASTDDASTDDASTDDAGAGAESRAFGRISGTLTDWAQRDVTSARTVPLEVELCAADQWLVAGDRCVDAAGREGDADVFPVEARVTGNENVGRSVSVSDERIELYASETYTLASPGVPDGTSCY